MLFFIIYLSKKDFIYLFTRDRQRQRHGQKEKQAPEPDAGLDTRTPGSCPEPKADTQPLSHPGAPVFFFYTELESQWTLRGSVVDSPRHLLFLQDLQPASRLPGPNSGSTLYLMSWFGFGASVFSSVQWG